MTGRGALAGPVVAAACSFPRDSKKISGIRDSKTIREQEREQLYERILAVDGVRWKVADISAAAIDDTNILQATMQAMQVIMQCN